MEMRNFKATLMAVSALAFSNVTFAADFVWPLSNSTTPDEMNTSFGPRINTNMWDFHHGIDLPASRGTAVYATRGGIVRRAGCGRLTLDCADPDSPYRSRHVILEVDDPIFPGRLFIVHLHLESTSVTLGDVVSQGQLLGAVGDDDASYTHLHFEFRKGSLFQIATVHPLGYMPYTDTPNFTAPVVDRFNRLGTLMAARLMFGAPSRLEGDLLRVEVDLKSGAALLEMRIVDFNDKTTVNEALGDEYIYVNDIGVEGYQKSNMSGEGREDLNHGILVRNIPGDCDTLVARVIDVGGNLVTSAEIGVPNQTATDEFIDFEDGLMPPAGGWRAVRSTSGTGTRVSNDPSAAHSGLRGMRCIDDSTTETSSQRAGIEYTLPESRFEWVAEGWFNHSALGLALNQSVYPILYLRGTDVSVAARIINMAGSLRAGIIVRNPDGSLTGRNSTFIVAPGVWLKWRLNVLRSGTRETTAVLYLGDAEETLRERLRANWDSRTYEPDTLRVGIGLSSAGATATVLADDVQLTERDRRPTSGR